MGDQDKNEETPEEQKPLSEMTAAEMQERFDAIVEGIAPVLDKGKDELTPSEKLAKRNAQEELTAIREAMATEDSDVDITPIVAEETPEPEETPAEDPAPVAEETPTEDEGPSEQSEEDKLIEALAAKAHGGSKNTDEDKEPEVNQADARRQPLVILETGETANMDTREAVMKAGIGASDPKDDWRVHVASGYDSARRAYKEAVVDVWESRRYSEDTQIMTNQASALQGAEIMGLTGDLNRADACNPRFINETEYCVAPESEAQAWMPKFAMDGECQVKTVDPETSTAPTFFEWAYDEDFSGTNKTGLVVGTDVPFPYDEADETTWKPKTPLTTACTENTWRLRSVGYIREINRGQDLCDPAAVARAMAQDTAYLEANKSQSVINAFDAYATANATTHTFDGVTGGPFNNPFSAIAMMFGEYNPAYENQYGKSMASATLFVPSNIAALMGVARYESLTDNSRYTVDELLGLSGAGDVVMTKQIKVTGGLDIDAAIPASFDPSAAGARTRAIPMYLSFRDGWRQGQGPGVRGSVQNDERNLRGNKRLMMVEDDLVNIHMGCLSTVKFTPTVCIQGGHTAGTAPVTC